MGGLADSGFEASAWSNDEQYTYFNGVRVGSVGPETPESYNVQREYTIPANLVKPGKNVIAIRVWDRYGGGGFTTRDPKVLQLKSPRPWVKPADMYHPDHREDFELGDALPLFNW